MSEFGWDRANLLFWWKTWKRPLAASKLSCLGPAADFASDLPVWPLLAEGVWRGSGFI